MTDTYPYALPLLAVPRAHSKTTDPISHHPPLSFHPGPSAPRPVAPRPECEEDHAGDRILLGLTLLTLPAVVYGLVKTWDLVSSGSLDQAIRAFF